MTVETTNNKISYAGDDASTVFPYNFEIPDVGAEVVILVDAAGTETTKIQGTDYSISGTGVSSGGNITMNVAPTTGETLLIKRVVALTQTADYQANSAFPAETHEGALDKLTWGIQQLQEQLDRSVTLKETSLASNLTIPDPVASTVLAFNAAADAIEIGPTIDEVSNSQQYSLNSSSFADASNASAAASSASAVEADGYADLAAKFSYSANFELPEDKTYTLVQSANDAVTLNGLTIQCSVGTCTISIEIDGVAVTGLNAVAVSTVEAIGTATALNTVSIGSKITITFSSASTVGDVAFTLTGTR